MRINNKQKERIKLKAKEVDDVLGGKGGEGEGEGEERSDGKRLIQKTLIIHKILRRAKLA
jgi:hypothetical protein